MSSLALINLCATNHFACFLLCFNISNYPLIFFFSFFFCLNSCIKILVLWLTVISSKIYIFGSVWVKALQPSFLKIFLLCQIYCYISHYNLNFVYVTELGSGWKLVEIQECWTSTHSNCTPNLCVKITSRILTNQSQGDWNQTLPRVSSILTKKAIHTSFWRMWSYVCGLNTINHNSHQSQTISLVSFSCG